MEKDNLSYLFQQYLSDQLTETEQEEWKIALADAGNAHIIRELVQQVWQRDDLLKYQADQESSDAILNYILEQPQQKAAKVYQLSTKLAVFTAAAIALIVLSLFLFKYNHQTAVETSAHTNPITAGGNKATLILANGHRISLTDAAKGELARQSGISITKTVDGQIVYRVTSDSKSGNSDEFNTIETPKGGQYRVVLPDNSSVWLNAASSLRYPVSFTSAKNRRVELQGEGYFEIAKDKSHPFIVVTKDQQVEVLGTHFNINTYNNEPFTRTTLLEGSVKVRSGKDAKILVPGQQSMLNMGNLQVTDADIELALGWKNNKFVFESQTIEDIMRMVERWYDVEVTYVGPKPNDRFGGSVSRFSKVSTVLGYLESTGSVHFKIEGRRILVSK